MFVGLKTRLMLQNLIVVNYITHTHENGTKVKISTKYIMYSPLPRPPPPDVQGTPLERHGA